MKIVGLLLRLQAPVPCPYREPDQFRPFLHPSSWRSILILYCHLFIRLPNCFFPSGLPTKCLMFLSCLLCVPHAPPIPLFFIWSPPSNTEHDGPCYVSLTTLLPRRPSYAILDAVKNTNIGTGSSYAGLIKLGCLKLSRNWTGISIRGEDVEHFTLISSWEETDVESWPLISQ